MGVYMPWHRRGLSLTHTQMTNTARAKVIYDWGTKPDRTPMGRGGIPEEIADVIVFLCSEEASFVTGATWNIDGGYMCF